LILCARAALSLLAAGLNALLCPFEPVAALLAVAPVFLCDLAVVFPEAEAGLFAGAVDFFFVACEVVDVAELEAFCVVSSYLFPSTEVTTISAQSSTAGAIAALARDAREKVACIVSL